MTSAEVKNQYMNGTWSPEHGKIWHVLSLWTHEPIKKLHTFLEDISKFFVG